MSEFSYKLRIFRFNVAGEEHLQLQGRQNGMLRKNTNKGGEILDINDYLNLILKFNCL